MLSQTTDYRIKGFGEDRLANGRRIGMFEERAEDVESDPSGMEDGAGVGDDGFDGGGEVEVELGFGEGGGVELVGYVVECGFGGEGEELFL